MKSTSERRHRQSGGFGRGRAFRALGLGITVGAVLALPGEAAALQGGEDPALLPVLIDKRFGHGGRHQASLMFTTSMVTKFVESVGLYGAYQFNFTDLWGIELSGGYFFGSETAIMDAIRAELNQEPQLSDQFQLQWMGNVDVMFTPIYGKISFASELDPAFDLFFVAGGGFAGTRRKSGGHRMNPNETFTTETTPAFNFGLGLRFYFSRLLALRLEFRDYFYPDPASYPAPAENPGGLTWNLHFQLGVQFAFGGD